MGKARALLSNPWPVSDPILSQERENLNPWPVKVGPEGKENPSRESKTGFCLFFQEGGYILKIKRITEG
ncbi:hypothetical protein HMPREF9130_1160 [Peptoniphilus sp. oral taxon 375 str. F0436]|nr:hypothetical protein HMPREF9130_1160 [Peptoniphilus sp. oral taxon 375 str. F0436]